MNEQDTVEEGRRVLRRRNAQEREQLVEEFKVSGMSQAAFCEERGIHLATFKSWFYKKQASRETHFAEVTVTMPDAGPVEVVFPSGVRANIRQAGSRTELIGLIRGLAGC